LQNPLGRTFPGLRFNDARPDAARLNGKRSKAKSSR
jgi:hypothetical protein